jgi:hypothetical protein
MLSEEVVAAVKSGRFHIYPVGNVDEGIELLTSVRAGEIGKDGAYEPGTVHDRVSRRLTQLAEEIVRFGDVREPIRPQRD